MNPTSPATYVLVAGGIIYGGFLLYTIRLFVRQTKLIAHMSREKVTELLPKAKQSRTSFLIAVIIVDIASWFLFGRTSSLVVYLRGMIIPNLFFIIVIVGLQCYVRGVKKRLKELSSHRE